ncbi:putative arabinose efflux permease, MFS family [Geosmithia morbida]|uniref:Arabinose efflux permease, MFS family n=1 Tax=Geosmithia morbida TaxID=1094350 RepID=A0A9P5D5Z8_9HYPO|nr:putative arabinose efflux permease, MFS family [Geosmithia morbida]KAF4123004.1 putative arabinose efflux permease, MFS family [Geosmithia morbida]
MGAPPDADAPTGSRFETVLSIVAASLALVSSVGFLNAFGVFQDYYEENELRDSSASDISWIGSASIFFLFALSPVAGILSDRIGSRILVIFGSIFQLLAVFMTSLCGEYYQFFLAQAVLLGVSMSFVTWPAVASVSRRTPKRRGLALGIVIAGSSVGGVIWPVALQKLLFVHRIGFPWTMRTVGFIMMAILIVVCIGTSDPARTPTPAPDVEQQQRATETSQEESVYDGKKSNDGNAQQKNRGGGKAEDEKLFTNPNFLLLCAAYALGYFGLFVPFFYVSIYASDVGVSSELSFYLISIVNGASFFGRIAPGHLADSLGHFNMAALAMMLSAIIAFTWTAATSAAGLIVWSLAYGFASGAILSLQGACAGKMASRAAQGRAIGGLTGSLAITALVGTPIGGQIATNYGFLPLSMYAGATLMAGAVTILFARLRIHRGVWVAY